MRWGFAPSWWKKPLRELPATFNARAETIAEKPMFRSAFASRRCVIPGVGLLSNGPGRRREVRIISRRATAARSAFAGFAELSRRRKRCDESSLRRSSSVQRIGWMRRFHDRMPIILDWRDTNAWMTGDDPGALLRAPPEEALQEWIVSPRVNRSGDANDDPTLIAPSLAATDLDRWPRRPVRRSKSPEFEGRDAVAAVDASRRRSFRIHARRVEHGGHPASLRQRDRGGVCFGRIEKHRRAGGSRA